MTHEQLHRGRRTGREDAPRPDRRDRRAAGAAARRVVRTAVSTPPRPGALADQVAAAVLRVPGVVGLHAGPDGLASTYLPDRWITGVRLHLTGCEVHVVTAWEASVGATTRAVRRAVAPLVDGSVDVTVAEIAPPTGQSTAPRSASAAERGGPSASASIAAGRTQPSTAASIRDVTVEPSAVAGMRNAAVAGSTSRACR